MAERLKRKPDTQPQISVTTEKGKSASIAGPKPVNDPANASLLALLKTEAEARSVESERELMFLIVNETRKLVRARQVFVLRRKRPSHYHVTGVSSVDAVDRNSPLIRWIERITHRLHGDADLSGLREFSIPAYCDDNDVEAATYPFANFLWVPFNLRDGDTYAGLLLTREQAWLEADMVVARRLGNCFSHAWAALTGLRRLRRKGTLKPYLLATAALLAIAALALPVPLTVLAQGQIVPRDPYVVAAPIDGIVDEIAIEPNTWISENQVLLRFVDITLRNELELAANRVRLATTKLKRDSQAAFEDSQARRELRLAMSELQLKKAEHDYASELLSKAVVRAPRQGVAVFASRKDWKGKPVSAGERIMQIADPAHVEVEVRLPVEDAIKLAENARVKLFLDADPLNSREATIVHISHEAAPDASNVLSYRVIARLEQSDRPVPRIGEHGAAQLFGDDVALFYYLFRRPMAALRQRTGL